VAFVRVKLASLIVLSPRLSAHPQMRANPILMVLLPILFGALPSDMWFTPAMIQNARISSRWPCPTPGSWRSSASRPAGLDQSLVASAELGRCTLIE